MIKRLVALSLALLFLLVVGWPQVGLAQADRADPQSFGAGLIEAANIATGNDLAETASVSDLLRTVINYILGFAGLLGVLFLVIAGAMYIISFGDEKKAAQAKKLILYVLSGLAIIGLAAVIVNTVMGLVK
jgi:hypothetical protein